MVKKRFAIQGMHCVGCALTIEGALEDISGVQEANVNYAHQWVDVEYDERLTTDERIVAVIQAAGYEARFQNG